MSNSKILTKFIMDLEEELKQCNEDYFKVKESIERSIEEKKEVRLEQLDLQYKIKSQSARLSILMQEGKYEVAVRDDSDAIVRFSGRLNKDLIDGFIVGELLELENKLSVCKAQHDYLRSFIELEMLDIKSIIADKDRIVDLLKLANKGD